MGRNAQPINLIVAKGRTHMGKAEIERRREAEVKVPFTDIQPPEYLNGKKARDEFMDIADKLLAIGIFTELDVDCLARYILSKALYLQYTTELTKRIKGGDADEIAKFQRLQAEAFKQCRACASDLGLTITSRCKLQVPKVEDESAYEL